MTQNTSSNQYVALTKSSCLFPSPPSGGSGRIRVRGVRKRLLGIVDSQVEKLCHQKKAEHRMSEFPSSKPALTEVVYFC